MSFSLLISSQLPVSSPLCNHHIQSLLPLRHPQNPLQLQMFLMPQSMLILFCPKRKNSMLTPHLPACTSLLLHLPTRLTLHSQGIMGRLLSMTALGQYMLPSILAQGIWAASVLSLCPKTALMHQYLSQGHLQQPCQRSSPHIAHLRLLPLLQCKPPHQPS